MNRIERQEITKQTVREITIAIEIEKYFGEKSNAIMRLDFSPNGTIQYFSSELGNRADVIKALRDAADTLYEAHTNAEKEQTG